MKNKILTFSYDDGVKQDIRLIELFNKYGVKGTFNINSELLDAKYKHTLTVNGIDVWHDKVSKEDLKSIYDGHEVAVHTLTHPLLPGIEDENEIIRQVEQDRLNLSELCGYEVKGMAYPCGGKNSDERVANIIKNNTGVKYSRTIVSTQSFDLQDDLYLFNPSTYSIHTDEMFRLGEEFLKLETDTTKIFYVWGHSYEFDAYGWDKIEEFLKMMSGKSDISYCTNKEAFGIE